MNKLLSINVWIYCFFADENDSGDNYVVENSERMYPFKKRKFFYQTSSSTSDSWSQSQGIVDSSYTRVNGTNHNAVIEESSSIADQQVHHGSKGCNGRIIDERIDLFRICLLYILIKSDFGIS